MSGYKKQMARRSKTYDSWHFDGYSVKQIIQELKTLPETAMLTFTGDKLWFEWKELETDEELESRLDQEKKAEKSAAAARRALEERAIKNAKLALEKAGYIVEEKK